MNSKNTFDSNPKNNTEKDLSAQDSKDVYQDRLNLDKSFYFLQNEIIKKLNDLLKKADPSFEILYDEVHSDNSLRILEGEFRHVHNPASMLLKSIFSKELIDTFFKVSYGYVCLGEQEKIEIEELKTLVGQMKICMLDITSKIKTLNFQKELEEKASDLDTLENLYVELYSKLENLGNKEDIDLQLGNLNYSLENISQFKRSRAINYIELEYPQLLSFYGNTHSIDFSEVDKDIESQVNRIKKVLIVLSSIENKDIEEALDKDYSNIEYFNVIMEKKNIDFRVKSLKEEYIKDHINIDSAKRQKLLDSINFYFDDVFKNNQEPKMEQVVKERNNGSDTNYLLGDNLILTLRSGFVDYRKYHINKIGYVSKEEFESVLSYLEKKVLNFKTK